MMETLGCPASDRLDHFSGLMATCSR